MKRLLAAAVMAWPLTATADHLDVIEVKLNADCSVDTYLQIARDFNSEWASAYDYRSEVLLPIQSHNLECLYWVGRSKTTEGFGNAWDAWVRDLKNPDSVAAKLWARFGKCGINVSRRGYDAY
ncbi:MAG: hypothetical protein FJ171_05110 [Gammaproteobacteria bacterium]|nr:hypothetical protein [Gammaproteobacteria bacterium]